MDRINEIITSIYCSIKGRLILNREGQPALEYIAIVVGLIIMVAVGFKIAGVNIGEKASNFVQDIINKAT